MSAGMCPAIRGRVFMSSYRQSFFADGEYSVQPRRQPQIFPRTQWPDKPKGPSRTTPTTKCRDEYDYAAICGNYSIQLLSPMPPYQDGTKRCNPTYRTSTWRHHVVILHDFLYDTLPCKKWMMCLEIGEFLSMISYGMNDYMAWLPHPFVFYGRPTEDHPTSFPVTYHPSLRAVVAEGEVGPQDYADSWTPARFKKHIQGRRFIVVPVNEHESHWLMTIFDREYGHLYIFDAVQQGREQRIKATVQTWARFWDLLGMPWHFTYFAPETSKQVDNYECGYLAIQWVVNMLRTNLGERMAATDDYIRTEDLWISAYKSLDSYLEDEYPVVDSSIRVCDWVPAGSRTTREATNTVMDWLKLMVANELGIRNSCYLDGTNPLSRRLCKLMFHEVPRWQWPSASDPLELHVPAEKLQFIRPTGVRPPNLSDGSGTGSVVIRVPLTYDELTYATDLHAVEWPGDEGLGYDFK